MPEDRERTAGGGAGEAAGGAGTENQSGAEQIVHKGQPRPRWGPAGPPHPPGNREECVSSGRSIDRSAWLGIGGSHGGHSSVCRKSMHGSCAIGLQAFLAPCT